MTQHTTDSRNSRRKYRIARLNRLSANVAHWAYRNVTTTNAYALKLMYCFHNDTIVSLEACVIALQAIGTHLRTEDTSDSVADVYTIG